MQNSKALDMAEGRHSGNNLRPNLVTSGRSFRPDEDHDAYEADHPGEQDKEHERYFH